MLTDGTGKTCVCDCENRLIQATLPNNELAKYFYDAKDRRIERERVFSEDLESAIYLYDEWMAICGLAGKRIGVEWDADESCNRDECVASGPVNLTLESCIRGTLLGFNAEVGINSKTSLGSHSMKGL
ncbi:MAG: hypothetical protein LBG65_06990 [Puniceicoccales bacterium]|jgi:YD repeat-containing protein|nr:hypothetical protein [Puniceicoccales bacterium]